MKKRVKDELIGKTIVEAVILTVIALIFWKLFLTYDYIPTVELAPKVLAVFSILFIVGAVIAGVFSRKKNDSFYMRYAVYGILYGICGLYIVSSQDIYFFRVVWAATAAAIVISIFYTVYRVKKF